MWDDCQYEETRRIQYDGGAVFVPVCEVCSRFVKANESIKVNEGIQYEVQVICEDFKRHQEGEL